MKYFFSILVFVFFCSCSTSTETTTTETPATINQEASDSKTKINSKEAESGRYQFLTYKGATILSKTTTYNFIDAKGKTVNIQVSNNPDFAKVKVPSSLLSNDRTFANEKMIGKKVEWIYDKAEQLVEVKMVE